MAGPFTHFLIVDAAKRRRSVIGSLLYRLLNKHSEFLYLGAVSPDLPYLSFKTGAVNWADLMHYESTNGIVLYGHDEIRKIWSTDGLSDTDERILAWLFGYASHLIADATIHPIVEAIVGPYEDNSTEHRICEMTQDSLVYYRRKNAEIRYTEFSSIIKYCGESKDDFETLMDFWQKQAVKTYPDVGEDPTPALWFKTYSAAIDIAEGGSGMVALFRHAGVAEDFIYKTQDEIVKQHPEDQKKYYTRVKLPGGGTGRFSTAGVDRAVENVADAWRQLYEGFESDVVIEQVVRNWNLDTGVEMDGNDGIKTYWV